MNTKALRQATVIITILTVLFATVYGIMGLPVPDWSEELILYIVAVLGALGIAVQSGQEALPLTWKTIFSKIASPVWWGAMASLVAFITTLNIGAGALDVLNIIKLVLFAIGAIIGALNDPNNKSAFKDNIMQLTTQYEAEPEIKPQ